MSPPHESHGSKGMTFFMFGKAHAALPLLCGPIPSRFSSPLFCHHVVRQIAELRPSHLVGDRKRWRFGQYPIIVGPKKRRRG